jgi:hypothetical protein
MRTFLLASLFAALATPALADPTPYQAAAVSASHIGYSEANIDAHHVRVSFSGNAETSRDAVEGFVLYRAAEITLLRGYDYFLVVDRNVETYTELAPIGPPMPPIAPRRYREINRYQASIDVVMRDGERPPAATNAFDPLEVRENLTWRVAAYRF